MEFSEQARAILGLISYVCWTLAYIFMIRRGVKDRSYGMPLIALFIDISWEFFFTFLADIDPQYKRANALWFFTNLGVLWTALRYGRDDFDWPILRRHFRLIAGGGLLAAFLVVSTFIRSFEDTYGSVSASLGMLVYSTLLPVMLVRRNSVKGQSLYVALLILIGDAVAYPVSMHAATTVQGGVPTAWIDLVFIYAVSMHMLYAWGVWYVARRDGLNPWRRA
ncbi:MAG: hypothetical protein D6701_09185 [Gemmatimonadetes bacterium]|nr:MAG: hypothetical protein D6701_09185 [Gemmatimonadota bacterium]